MPYKPPYTTPSQIINLISEISQNIGKLETLNLDKSFQSLRKNSKVKSITGTLQIEGNTLTENQITGILEGKRVLGSVKEITEAKGAIELYERVDQFNYKDINALLEAHKILMGDLLKNAGTFRNQNVGVGSEKGVVHVAPPRGKVSELMENLMGWLTQTNEHPLIVSSVFHYEFEFIHPFIDGNGRIGRYWQSLILYHWKPIFQYVPIESIVNERKNKYYNVLQECGKKGESTTFIQFMLDSILVAVNQLLENDHVGDQVTDQVKKLINVMSGQWMSSNEIMALLSMSHKPTFRKNYLKPALELGWVEMKDPNSPKSPQQKYRLNK